MSCRVLKPKPGHRIVALTLLLLSAPLSVDAGGMPPAQFLEQHGSGAAFSTGDYVSVSAPTGLNTSYRYFIEVPPGAPRLNVDLFDADFGMGGAGEVYDRAAGGFNSSIQYMLVDPSGTMVASITGTAAAPAGSNNAWIPLYTTPNPANGHWQLIVDSSSAVTTGDDRSGYAVRANDGDPSALGTELNIYADSFLQVGIHAGAAVTWNLFPYITGGGSPGFEADSNDFDLDGNGGVSLTSRNAGFTHTNATVSGGSVWLNEAFSGWTSDYLADGYGIWPLDLRVAGAPNYVTYYIADWRAANPNPTSQPEPRSYRIYLQNDAGLAPQKPYVSQTLSWMGGPNPPMTGSTTTVRVLVTVANPTAQPITFSPSNQVTARVPGSGTVFAGSDAATLGTVTSTPPIDGTGDVTWNPGSLAGGATAMLSYDVDVSPVAVAERIPITGDPAANGTAAVFLDETANAAQAVATFTFGPLSALIVTEGSLLPGDTDGDGIPDLIESSLDTDGDGRPDYLDLDSDDDGIEDSVEGLTQSDGDMIPDYLDLDSDGDGVWDLIEGNDQNRNGVTDHAVTDSDNDGRIDVIVDIDSDGLDDAYDTSLGGGIAAATQDTDGDSIPDWRDVDDDGDGIPTANEDGNNNGDWSDDDSDGDLRPAYLDVDADGDGIPDAVEGNIDSDGDGIPDFLDPDSDNDGIPDAVEGAIDSDGDGIPNYRDRDSDNDGIPDAVEGAVDRDGDGIFDYLDLDSDNDGVPDTIESGAPDANRDGVIDGFTDLDRDGMHDPLSATPLPVIDRDGDGVVDRNDLDADNDGIPDTIESGASDTDRDGYVDPYVDANGNGLADLVDPAATPPGTPLLVIDSDFDGVVDRDDVDADNDGITDCREASGPDPGPDADGDGRIDGFSDVNGNGLADLVDPAAAPPGTPLAVTNTDGVDLPDYIDSDSDGDGLTDVEEGFEPDLAALAVDADGDGLDDAWDPSLGGTPANLPDGDLDLLRDWRDPLSCLVANIPPITPLYLIQVGTDVRLSWPMTPDSETYNVWVVDGNASSSNKSAIPNARLGGPWPSVAGCFDNPASVCVDLGAVTGADGDLKSYQVRGVCGSVEAVE